MFPDIVVRSFLQTHWRRKLLKVRGITLLNKLKRFSIAKLHSYGRALNFRGAMAPLFPLPCSVIIEYLQHSI